MSIFNEVQQMEHLTVLGKSLIHYASSIEPGLVFERNSVGWVPADERNFVGFRFQWSDSLSITLSLYGDPEEHFVQDDLDIKRGKCNNSLARITEHRQLMAATVSIWRAHQLFHQGSNRESRALLLIEELGLPARASARPNLPRAAMPDPVRADFRNPAQLEEWLSETAPGIGRGKPVDAPTL